MPLEATVVDPWKLVDAMSNLQSLELWPGAQSRFGDLSGSGHHDGFDRLVKSFTRAYRKLSGIRRSGRSPHHLVAAKEMWATQERFGADCALVATNRQKLVI